MILHAIDYNGGQIWVDKKAKVSLKDTVFIVDSVGIVDYITKSGLIILRFEKSFFTETYDGAIKIVAQSPNLSLPNIPYVEIEEDDSLEAYFIEHGYKEDERRIPSFIRVAKNSQWTKGYKAASANKYKEEDLRKAIYMAWDRIVDTKNVDDIIQSLRPKVVSIEVEMKETGAICKTCNNQGVRHCAHPEECGACEPIVEPVTYTKDGKTFLKVKKVNYEHTANNASRTAYTGE